MPIETTKGYGFLNLSGWPCLYGSYYEPESFESIDRTTIVDNFSIDSSDPLTAVVDISVNDIGVDPIDNGNAYRRLTDRIVQSHHQLGGYLDVIRPGMHVTVHYQLENADSGQLLRRSTARMFVKHPTYYIDSDSVGGSMDPVYYVNHADQCFKPVIFNPAATNGVIVRLTKVSYSYLCLRRYDEHHDHSEHSVLPPGMKRGTRFYHFEDNGRGIRLHSNEINNEDTIGTYEIPISSVNLNQSIVASTGYRLLFRVSVWKNDQIMVSNPRRIFQLLGSPTMTGHDDQVITDSRIDQLTEKINELQYENRHQEHLIYHLQHRISELQENQNSTNDPDDTVDPSEQDPIISGSEIAEIVGALG